MAVEAPTSRLEEFAAGYRASGLNVHRAAVVLDERQDGEPVTRVMLLLDDPGSDTWEIERVEELRRALGRKAAELDLPSISVTLVPESESEAFDPFTR